MKKLWTILLAVLLVTGLTLTGCGEIPDEAPFTLSVKTDGDGYAGNPRIHGDPGPDLLITGILVKKGSDTLFDLADWVKANNHVGTDPQLAWAGNPTYVVDQDAGTILITGRTQDYFGLDIGLTAIGATGNDVLDITVTGVFKIGSEVRIGGSDSPYPLYGKLTVTE